MAAERKYGFRLYESRDAKLIEWLEKKSSPKGNLNTVIRLALEAAMENENNPAKYMPYYPPQTQMPDNKNVKKEEKQDPEKEIAKNKLLNLF